MGLVSARPSDARYWDLTLMKTSWTVILLGGHRVPMSSMRLSWWFYGFLWRRYAILGIISNMTDTNCCHFTLYMETLVQVSIFTSYRKTLSRLKLFPGRWSVLTCLDVSWRVLTCLDVCRCGTYLSFFCEYTKASGHRKRVPGLETWWHAGITTDGSLWAYAMSGDGIVWDCLAGAVALHGHHGPGIVPMDSNGYQWYSWWGIAFSQVSPCSVPASSCRKYFSLWQNGSMIQ